MFGVFKCFHCLYITLILISFTNVRINDNVIIVSTMSGFLCHYLFGNVRRNVYVIIYLYYYHVNICIGALHSYINCYLLTHFVY